MPPLPNRGPSTLARLTCLAVVGGVATALYASLTWTAVTVLGLPIALASPVAYGVAAIWSFRGHRHLTFRDRLPHSAAPARFLALTLIGYGAASAIPAFVSGWLAAPPEAAILIVCLAIPALNYIVLNRHVFAHSRAPSPSATAFPTAGPSAG